jgi:hypothetical protein
MKHMNFLQFMELIQDFDLFFMDGLMFNVMVSKGYLFEDMNYVNEVDHIKILSFKLDGN